MGVVEDLRGVRRTRFLRHLLMLVAGILLLGPLAGRIVVYPLFSDLVVQGTETEAVRVARFLGNDLGLAGSGVKASVLPQDLDTRVRYVAQQFDLAKVKLFSASGEVVYSTDEGDVGQVNRHDYFREQVAQGRPYTKVVSRDRPSLEGQRFNRDVVETYVPLMAAETGAFVGAFEIYYDVSERLGALRDTVNALTVASLAAATVLLLLLLYLMGRAGRAVEERRRVERELWQLSHQNQMILATAGEGIFGVDGEGRLSFVNPAAQEMLGWSADELMGERHHELVHHSRADGSPNPSESCPVRAAFREGRTEHSEHEYFWRRDGSGFPVEMTSAPLVDEGKVKGAVVVFRDITRRLQAERALQEANAKLAELARRDALTGQPNRRAFDEHLRTVWREHQRGGAPLTVLMVDVDAFKAYNDLYGHPAGDQCLRRVADALAAHLFRPTDFLARYGGEELVLVLAATGREGAEEVASRLCAAVEALRIRHAASPVSTWVTVSVGGASDRPGPDAEPGGLLEAADGALYEAKRSGRNRFRMAS